MHTCFFACFHSGTAGFTLGIHPLEKIVGMGFVLLGGLCGDWCFTVGLFAGVSGWKDCAGVKRCEEERRASEMGMEQRRDFEECWNHLIKLTLLFQVFMDAVIIIGVVLKIE